MSPGADDRVGKGDAMKTDEIHGIEIRGENPQFLLLSDGSALTLDPEGASGRGADWKLVAPDGQEHNGLSVTDAIGLAGKEFSGYVAVRTRAEVEWLRTVAEWYRDEAEALSRDLDVANRV
jgi:hypothetical protein